MKTGVGSILAKLDSLLHRANQQNMDKTHHFVT